MYKIYIYYYTYLNHYVKFIIIKIETTIYSYIPDEFQLLYSITQKYFTGMLADEIDSHWKIFPIMRGYSNNCSIYIYIYIYKLVYSDIDR